MASNRYRSRRSIGKMVNRVDLRLEYLQKRPAPRRLQPYSVFTQSLSRHAIARENIATAAVDGDKIADNSIDNSHMQYDSINADNIQARTITAEEITAGTITADEIMTRSLTADLIQVGAITATEIMANTITGDEITANVKLSAPMIYGGGVRAYDVINPDPTTYIGSVPGVPYMAIAAKEYPSAVTKSQITCSSNGTISIFANAGIDWVNINGDIVATRPWVNANYSGSGHGHGSHSHTVSGASTNSVSVSDERLKLDIEPLDAGLSFIEALSPVKFRMVNGNDAIITSDEQGNFTKSEEDFRPGVRTHYGLIAQQVKEVVDTEVGDDFAGWVHTEEDVQMLRYDEFIAPLIKAVQELSEQNREMRAELESLKSKLQ